MDFSPTNKFADKGYSGLFRHRHLISSMGWLVSAGWVPAFLIIPLGDLEELGSMDRGLMKRVRELSERRAEAASIKGAVGPQMDRWGMAAAAMGNSEAVAYREGVWIHHSLAYPVYFANVPPVGVVGASNVEALVRRIRYLRWKLNLPAPGGDSNAPGASK